VYSFQNLVSDIHNVQISALLKLGDEQFHVEHAGSGSTEAVLTFHVEHQRPVIATANAIQAEIEPI
jgi:hypothetical protein